MTALDLKVLRNLRQLWAQILAIALVLACGIMVMTLSTGTQRSLNETMQAYYEEHRFADVFAHLSRAPRQLVDHIKEIDGVLNAEARVVSTALIDLPDMTETASVRVISLPDVGEPILNVPLIRKGRLPDPLKPFEAVVSEPFAEANGLGVGDKIAVILNGNKRDISLTGIVLSPEYIYTIGNGALMPDDLHFGIMWMREATIAPLTGYIGAFNDITLSLSRDANEVAVIDHLDQILKPYGGVGAYGRDKQGSNMFIESEMQQLGAMSRVLPPIFLIVSAFLVNMVLSRLIALERSQIGLLKALGYSTRSIAGHYLKLILGCGVLGVLIGWVFGWWLGLQMTALYTEYFRFPWLDYRPGVGSFVISAILGIASVTLGALKATYASARLAPAVAMSPPAPPVFRHNFADRIGRALKFGQTTMMVVRSITRWPGRALVTLFGVSGSVAVLVASFFTFDAIDLIMSELFDVTNKQDATLVFTKPTNESAVSAVEHLPGVIAAEGSFSMPVRLSVGAQEYLVSLSARDPDVQLTHLVDTHGVPQPLLPWGLVMPEGLARKLEIEIGDSIDVELLQPPLETWHVPVTQLVRQSLGTEVFMDSSALFELLHSDPRVTSVNLAIDTNRVEELQAMMPSLPMVASFTLWSDVKAQFDETLNESLISMTVIFSVLGILIAVGVIYNAARIQLAERERELASLRVLGFHKREVGYVLNAEQIFLAFCGVPIGWIAGYAFALMMSEGFSTDVVSIPVVITQRTFAFAAAIAAGSVVGALFFVRRRLDRADIIASLKQRE